MTKVIVTELFIESFENSSIMREVSINRGDAFGCQCHEWDDDETGTYGCPAVIEYGDECIIDKDYGAVCVPCGSILRRMNPSD
jgi:hypothetical protein